MPISLGSLHLEERELFAQLRQDLKDDWFPDPLLFSDLLSSDQIKLALETNVVAHQGDYVAAPANVFNIPKAGFTLRQGTETGLPERALYHGLVSGLVPHYDPLLPWSVFNHRANARRSSSKYLFNNPIDSWSNFLGATRSALETSPALLSTDLSNYYENIDLSTLEKALIGLLPEIDADSSVKSEIRSKVRLILTCLDAWSQGTKRGLPQNRDASSFLANMYMLPVDRAMSRAGYRYFRYMDDIKIACRDVFQARLALKQLTLALRELGLSINSGKTLICEPGDASAIANALDEGGPELQRLSAVWSTRSLRPISRSFQELQGYTLALLTDRKVDSRAFRFCIRRLEVLATCTEFAVPPEYFAPVTPRIIDALSHSPSSTDQFARYLRAVPTTEHELEQIAGILLDDSRNFYTWQCYRLWTLLVAKAYRSTALIEHAAGLVEKAGDTPNRSGAALYLGALGDEEGRLLVATHFAKSRSYLGQRSSIIALQELPYPVIRDRVQADIRPDLVGVYRHLHVLEDHRYVTTPEPESITSYVDLGRDYD